MRVQNIVFFSEFFRNLLGNGYATSWAKFSRNVCGWPGKSVQDARLIPETMQFHAQWLKWQALRLRETPLDRIGHWNRLRIRRARAEALGCIVLETQDAKVEILDYVTSPSHPTSLPTTISFIRVAAPLNAQSVQDEFISDRQLAAVQDQPIGITNNGAARDTPRLMTSDPGTMITD